MVWALNSEAKCLEFDCREIERLSKALDGGRWQGFSLPPLHLIINLEYTVGRVSVLQ